jgi:hypothetical protein
MLAAAPHRHSGERGARQERGITMDISPLGAEWVALQRDHERYEAAALAVKLVAVILATLGIAFSWPTVATLLPLPVLWLQEGILRTSQSRLGARLLRIESGRSEAFRLHTEWQADRPGVAGLLAEYFRNAVRPTVAFPYAVVLVVTVIVVSAR